jgi:hypothetical protein
MASPDKYLPIEVAKYYPKEAPFLLSRNPSGDEGAECKFEFSLDNYPDIIYGLRGTVVYALPAAFENENFNFRQLMKQGGVDEGFDIEVTLTQSNITTGWVPAPNFWGSQGINWHPLAVPYMLRGGNNVTVKARRTISYPHPTFGDPEQTLNVAPTLKLTLVTGVLVADTMPGSAPGSTGAP